MVLKHQFQEVDLNMLIIDLTLIFCCGEAIKKNIKL